MSPRKALIKDDFPAPTRPTIHDNSPFRAEKSMFLRIVGVLGVADHLNVPFRMRTVSSSMYCTGGSLLTAEDCISSARRNSFRRVTETLASTRALQLDV
jgi:hypothetical protein